ncbi:MAG TPA: fused MFS/spermidine synthase [Vicinamibacteria bacterium]|nr:fused MFS/spermidine synthase [Vicinamibacteria bacterium]
MRGSKKPTIAVGWLAFFFIGSGFSALAYQVILSRYVQLIVGVTAHAISALLVAFMLGTSIGAAIGGRIADRSRHPLRVYAVAELAIGAYCLVFPLLYPLLQSFYLEVVPPIDGGALWARNAVRFLLGVMAFLLPAIFMGITTPAFARAVASHRLHSGRWLARLYGWNTLGAALGAFASAYLLVPKLGLIGSLAFASVLNFTVGFMAYRRSTPMKPTPLGSFNEFLSSPGDTSPRSGAIAGLMETLRLEPLGDLGKMGWKGDLVRDVVPLLRRLWSRIQLPNLSRPALEPTIAIFVVIAFVSGFLSFALEIIWTHLLVVLIGNAVYAFGLMLGSLLLGLAIGTVFARRLAEPLTRALSWIGISLALAGATVLLTLGVWDEIPGVFLLLARSAPSFLLMESVRFLVALLLMLLPTAAFGVSFPLILHCSTSRSLGFGLRVGQVYTANTLGAVMGALAGSYVILPAFGSLDSLKLLGSLLLVVGGGAILVLSSLDWRKTVAAVGLSALFWGPWFPVQWDLDALNMAAAIYLGDSASSQGTVSSSRSLGASGDQIPSASRHVDRPASIIFRREDATGGLTSVVDDDGVRTLLTNGKFQGDNSEEVPVQHRLANIPTLFTAERKRAFVLGLGTGVTLASVASHGFEEVVCAELSEPIVEAAATHFADVNGGVLGWPQVTLLREDGRSALLEQPDRYDVISLEVTSIWFAGVGSIYSREFYQLASSRLRRNGVLLQYFPIHHLSARNLFLVVNTARSVFPHVSVWTHRHQGFLVASNDPLEIDLESVRSDRERPEMRRYLRELASGSPLELLSDLVVTDKDVDRFLDTMSLLLRMDRGVVSTDAWPTLEYETPKDLLENFSFFQNRFTFRRFRSTEPFSFRGEPTRAEEALAAAAFSHGWEDARALPRLGELWKMDPALSGVASRWILDELVGSEVGARTFDAMAALDEQLPALARVLGATGSARCEDFPPFLSQLDRLPVRLGESSGESVGLTRPENAVDGIARPELGAGWQVRPEGAVAFIELALAEPTRVGRVSLVAEPIDGHAVRTRLFGRDEDGAWLPLVSGGEAADLFCNAIRVHELSERLPSLTFIRVELESEAISHRLTLHEVWAEGAAIPRDEQ